MNSVAIIGSGFAGLSAACFLAKEGFDVTVFEKNSSPGGRARKFQSDGYTFDMGPSWYWMPDVFESFFKQFGHNVKDFYELKRLDPSYKVFYSQEQTLDIPANFYELCKLFDSIEPGSSKHLTDFLEESKFKYEVGIQNLVYKPGLSVSELIHVDVIKGILKLHIFHSMASYVRKHFKDPRLIQLLEFPVLFLGAAPSKTPALYSLMNYADIALGTWYPEGGIYQVINGMVKLATSLGVRFEYNSPVQEIMVEGKKATGLRVLNTKFRFDYVVASADYHHVEQKLLPPTHRKYSDAYWQKRTMAPSSLIFYLGISKKLKNLEHHNLFFDQDFPQHTQEIYDDPKWPTNPLFYVCCTSKSDETVAPAGHENVFVLIPVATGLADDDATRKKYFDIVIDRLEKLTSQEIRPHVVFNRSYAHRDFISDYNAFKGNAYGLANTLMQTANLKPSIRNKKVKNLFYTGQLTVPGPGVPPSIISGQVVAKELVKSHKAAWQNEYVI